MKPEDIHRGLDKKEIRDFLGKQLRKCGWIRNVDIIKKEIEDLKSELKKAEAKKGILQLIKEMGWSGFDISRFIGYDKDTYFDFIGTEEEVKKFEEGKKE